MNEGGGGVQQVMIVVLTHVHSWNDGREHQSWTAERRQDGEKCCHDHSELKVTLWPSLTRMKLQPKKLKVKTFVKLEPKM